MRHFKFLKQLGTKHRRGKVGEHDVTPTEEPSVSAEHTASAELEALARDPRRCGLKRLPSIPHSDVVSETSYHVNVIAVHGLGGDFYRTWTSIETGDPRNDTLWLSHLLSRDLPGAGIFSFGYESTPTFSRSVTGIRDSARTLLSYLLSITEEWPDRPFVFICHSLGGIVVKQAMIIAHEDDHFAPVLQATGAIMFMGTPHRGSQLATALSQLAKITNFWLHASYASAIAGSMRTDLIDALSRDSAKLDEINESFKQRAKTMTILSCYERVKLRGSPQLIVEKHSSLLGLSDEVIIPIQADHVSMCRFSSADDPGYELVSKALLRTVKQLVTNRSQRSFTESERRYVASFGTRYFIDVEERVQGTCSWSTNTSEYLMWRSEEQSAVLWLTGEAGCGKTVLTNFLVQELKADTISESRNVVNNDVVCCFFCARDVEAQKDARTLLRDLILQILASKKEIIHQIKKTYGSTEHKYDPSFETLWRMFEMAVELAPCKHLYIVIDALDECEEKSKSKLLSKFSSSLPLQVKSGSARRKNVKFIISGLPHVRVAWKTSTVFLSHFHIKIEERPQGMVDDVKLFVDDRVDDLVINSICSKSSGEKLKTELHKLAENSFLWLSVVLNHIKNSLTYRDADLQRLLADIPPRLIIDAYTKYIPSLAVSEIPRLRGYLQLITACARPLRLSEVDAFIELSNNPTASVLTSEDETVIAGSLRRALGPLVKFPDSSVQLIHSTVKDYFTGLGSDTRHPFHQSHGIDADSAHLFCARACMRYLAHDDMPSDLFDREESTLGSCSPSPISVRRSPPSTNESGLFADLFDIQDVEFLQDERTFLDNANADIRARYHAYDYAASHWAYHYAESENLADESVMQEAITLLSTHLVRSSNWYRYKVHQSSITMPSITEADALTLAAFFNHVRILHTLLLREPSNQPRPNLQSSLYWAASRGQDESLKVLLEHGVRPIDPEYGQSALAIAIQGGFTDTCNILLEAGGANPNYFNRESRPPLVLAASYNHCEILHMLLQHSGIQVNQADGAGHTALIEACHFGSIECIQEILKDGRSDMNAVDRLGRSALIHASISGKDQIVKSLLATSHLEQNIRDSYGRNAISYAATHCQLATVKRLFHANVFIAARDLTGRNAISWAADSTKALEDGDDDQPCVLEYLVKKCPEATDVPDRSGWAPLAWATEGPGYLRSIQILLEIGRAEVNQKDQTSGRPILAWLASKNLAAAIEYLLQTRNIDKNATDREGRTPLSYAAGNGSLESVRVLLNDEEVMIDQCDSNGRTPMDWAALNYYDSIVQLLSEHRRRGGLHDYTDNRISQMSGDEAD